MSLPVGEQEGVVWNWREDVKDSVTVLAGASAVIVVLVWFFGLGFSNGYFESMNIPLFQLSFTLWDYGGVSVVYLLLSCVYVLLFVGTLLLRRRGVLLLQDAYTSSPKVIRALLNISVFVVLVVVFFGTFYESMDPKYLCGLMIYGTLVVIASKGKSDEQLLKEMIYNGEVRQYTFKSLMQWASFAFVFVMLLLLLRLVIQDVGSAAGRRMVTERAPQVRLIVSRPVIASHDVVVTGSSGESLYTYENLRLLTYNNGKYFLYSTVGEDCKPEQVYIIREESIMSTEYMSSVPIKPNCIPSN